MSTSDSVLLYLAGLLILSEGVFLCWLSNKQKDSERMVTDSLVVVVGLAMITVAIIANQSLFYLVISSILKFFFEVAVG